jgi:integrase
VQRSGRDGGEALTRLLTTESNILAFKRSQCPLSLEARLERGTHWQDHGLMFPPSVGTPISGGNLNRAFKSMLQRTGLPKCTCYYDLRHICATLLLKQGVNPKLVQELLGHADISLTFNIYSHLSDMGDAAAEAMDAALG